MQGEFEKLDLLGAVTKGEEKIAFQLGNFLFSLSAWFGNYRVIYIVS